MRYKNDSNDSNDKSDSKASSNKNEVDLGSGDLKLLGISSLVVFLLTPIFVILMLVNAAYPAMLVWNLWIPDYIGLPSLTLPLAIILVLTINILKGDITSRTEDTRSNETKSNDLIMLLITPWLGFFIAFITHRFFIL